MNSRARDCLAIMFITFLVDILMFGAAVYQQVIITETHPYIATGITLIFLAAYAGYLYHSRYPIATRARGNN